MENHFGRSTQQVAKLSPLLASFQALSSVFTFGSRFFSKPSETGSLLPSLPALGRRIARCIPLPTPGYVVELGAGTGAVTGELLKHGVSPARFVCLDNCDRMTRTLRRRYPELTVITGDATRLATLLEEVIDLQSHAVTHIVSCLPLISLPKDVVSAIVKEIDRVLAPAGRLIQFTYDLRPRPHPALDRFHLASSSIVWGNLPPARVNIYRRTPRRRS